MYRRIVRYLGCWTEMMATDCACALLSFANLRIIPEIGLLRSYFRPVVEGVERNKTGTKPISADCVNDNHLYYLPPVASSRPHHLP